jgi:hypothetical protein
MIIPQSAEEPNRSLLRIIGGFVPSTPEARPVLLQAGDPIRMFPNQASLNKPDPSSGNRLLINHVCCFNEMQFVISYISKHRD